LDDYISRTKPDQHNIYYFMAANRDLAENSPYFESFKEKGLEVLFIYQTIDEFAIKNLDQYNKRKFVSIDSAEGLLFFYYYLN